MKRVVSIIGILLVCLALTACGGGNEEGASAERGAGGGSGGGGSQGGFGGPGGGSARAAVPVEVAPVVRRTISSFIETNGTLEAENDVDLVARSGGPVTSLRVDEMDQVVKGQLLARIDQDEARSRLDVSRVALEEAKLNFERAERLYKDELLSREDYDRTRSALQSAQAQLQGNQIQLDYTEVRAPFSGVISRRYIKQSQNVQAGTPLLRLTSFDPLLAPMQIPEQDLPLLSMGQPAHVVVEAYPEERFEAKVLRISPVVDAATGTIRVTLEVEGMGRLRPGMFASVYLETESRQDALVIPKAALALDSIGDTVYVAEDGTASRREVQLGFTEGDSVQVVSGVEAGERVVVVGQDGLSDGTPIEILGGPGPEAEELARGPEGGNPTAEGSEARPDVSAMSSDERLEAMKKRMRERGMSEEQIEERVKQFRERQP